MSVIATALKHLIAAGVSGDDLVRAVAEMEAAMPVGVDPVAEKRRAYDRERKRQAKRNSTGIPPAPVENAEFTPSLDKEKSPRPPKEINPTPGDNSTRVKPTKFELPSDIPATEWAGFEEMRRRIGKPMTDRARTLAICELRKLADDGYPPGEVLNHSTMNSYQGIFPPKDRHNGRDRQGSSQGRQRVDGFTAALRDVASRQA